MRFGKTIGNGSSLPAEVPHGLGELADSTRPFGHAVELT